MVVVAAAQSPAAGAPKVLLLSGQPAAAAAAAGAPVGRALPVMVPGQRGASPEAASGGPPQARKRQRLTHLSPEEKALRRWARVEARSRRARAWGLGPNSKAGTEFEGETGTWGRADRPQRSGVGGWASPVPAWRGAGQEVWTSRSTALGGVQSCAGLFYLLLFYLIRDNQSWVSGYLGSRPSSCDHKPVVSFSELGL